MTNLRPTWRKNAYFYFRFDFTKEYFTSHAILETPGEFKISIK